MTLPERMDEESVARWRYVIVLESMKRAKQGISVRYDIDRAIIALVEAKVRETVEATKDATDPYCECDNSGTGGPIHIRFDATDEIVARVMGRVP